jgi:hypothetical protein
MSYNKYRFYSFDNVLRAIHFIGQMFEIITLDQDAWRLTGRWISQPTDPPPYLSSKVQQHRLLHRIADKTGIQLATADFETDFCHLLNRETNQTTLKITHPEAVNYDSRRTPLNFLASCLTSMKRPVCELRFIQRWVLELKNCDLFRTAPTR